MYWVYILENYLKDDYISVTIDMTARLKEHKEEILKLGLDPTKLKVKYQEYHANAVSALGREKKLKSMTPFRLKKYLDEIMRKQGLI